MLGGSLGVRLVMLVGKQVPAPAPYAVMTALTHVQVVNDTRGDDGFQMMFALGKGRGGELALLKSGVLEPDTNVALGMILGARALPLIRGVIYHHQLTPDTTGNLSLTVMGRDLTALLDLEVHDVEFPSQTDSEIVKRVLGAYARYGLVDLSNVQTTSQRPAVQDRVTQQHETDLAYVRRLARRNGFVFYLEPAAMATTAAYWGPIDRPGAVQSALTCNLGSLTNVTEIHFAQDALAPRCADGYYIDAKTGQSQKIPTPSPTSPTIARPVAPRKADRLRSTSRFTPAEAQSAIKADQADTPDAVTAEGSLDTLRYGDVLRAHRRVSVRGAGRDYDGDYEVRKVIHDIEPGTYSQKFSLGRLGLAKA